MAIVDGSLQLGYKDSAWFTANATLVLLEGQIVYLEQTGTYKIGDGTTQLSALTFLGSSSYTPQTLADVLAIDNKTGGFDITSDDGNSVASIVDTEIFLYSGTTNAGKLYLSQNESNLYNSNGGFYVSEGTVIVPNYIQLKSDEAIIKHNTKITLNTAETDINSLLSVITPSGKSAHYVNDSLNSSVLFGTGFYGEIGISRGNCIMYCDDRASISGYVSISTAGNEFTHSVRNTFDSPVNEFTNGGIYFGSGIGIDTTSTAGTDVLNIGATNANVINYGNASTIHNFLGTAIYELQVNSYVEDKLITLNYGGAVGSGIGVGFEIEENNTITGYFKTNSARNGFSILTPAIAYKADLNLDLLTSDRTYSLPNGGGVLALESFVDSKVTDAIIGGITTVAPSQNAVYDALALKLTQNNFTDITSSCTIVGWSSYTTNSIRSVDMGDYYIVTGYITGTSNSVITTVQLPYTNNGHRQGYSGYGVNNGTSVFTRVLINGASDTIDFRTGAAGQAWATVGAKEITFNLIIEK